MKRRISITLTVLGLLLGFWPLRMWLPATAAGSPLPALQGEAALDHLKEQGLYGSLQEAITAGRYGHYRKSKQGGVWPMTIAPTFTRHRQLMASGAAKDDYFGISVAINAETAVIGAPAEDGAGGANQGSVYVFVRSGGTWSQQQKLVASDAAEFDEFGFSVAINGETIVVGAWRDDGAAGSDQGSAYVFVRSGGVWSQQQKILAPDAAAGAYFGLSVAISGETIVAGAPRDNDGVVDQGSAYVFLRSGGVWSQQQKLLASDAAAGANFGHSVAISGETVVVSAPSQTLSRLRGSAYVFVRSGIVWSQQQKLLASDGVAGVHFGVSVAINGDTLVVGASGDVGATGRTQGSAYVFARSGTRWSQLQKLHASDGAEGDQFGASIAISGETVVVGAHLKDGAAGRDQGSAYLFVRSGARWNQRQRLLASDAAADDLFGRSVALSGETVVIGAPLFTGSAYVFARSETRTSWVRQHKLAPSSANTIKPGR